MALRSHKLGRYHQEMLLHAVTAFRACREMPIWHRAAGRERWLVGCKQRSAITRNRKAVEPLCHGQRPSRHEMPAAAPFDPINGGIIPAGCCYMLLCAVELVLADLESARTYATAGFTKGRVGAVSRAWRYDQWPLNPWPSYPATPIRPDRGVWVGQPFGPNFWGAALGGWC